MPTSDVSQFLTLLLGVDTLEMGRWALAWARLAPLVVIVPAFGLRAVPGPMRIALALGLAFAVAPALRPVLATGPWLVRLAAEFVRGLPVAITAALTLWIAQMVGGLIDNLRGSQDTSALPVVEPDSTPTGALLTLLVAIAFLQGGGAAHVADRVARAEDISMGALQTLVVTLSSGVGVAMAVATPVVVVTLVVEVTNALLARAASPAFLLPTLAPLRTLAVLGVTALVLDRIVEFLVLLQHW
ncbi:MAG TPA: flagellar biosynthetic protein FliR [Polyangiaceae bacterium]|nr:flagellar biosynthetic protein FliR [Polyangiaceae bacterium]